MKQYSSWVGRYPALHYKSQSAHTVVGALNGESLCASADMLSLLYANTLQSPATNLKSYT